MEYKNLALIITDEEHKFGVVHRDSFREKALEGFHQITMSATPIPKSIAATLYDDTMDINFHKGQAGKPYSGADRCLPERHYGFEVYGTADQSGTPVLCCLPGY